MLKFSPLKSCLLLILFLHFGTLWADGFTSPFGQAFVKISAGEFVMGTQYFDLLAKEVKPERLQHLKKELPPHRVKISKDFYLATTEVTQGMWLDIMGYKTGKRKRWQREDWAQLPVSRVDWDSAQEFIEMLNHMSDQYHYRLPTEAEWEYAARAGTTGLRFYDISDMHKFTWFRDNSGDKPMPVGTLQPNAWGLYDMIGNVWEWVEDSFDREYYQVSPVVDPKGPKLAKRKVMRGGSYHCTSERARVGIRGTYTRDRSLSVLGFRLAAEKK